MHAAEEETGKARSVLAGYEKDTDEKRAALTKATEDEHKLYRHFKGKLDVEMDLKAALKAAQAKLAKLENEEEDEDPAQKRCKP